MIIIYLCTFLLGAAIFWKFTRRTPIPKGLRRIPTEKGLPFVGVLHQIETPIFRYYERLIKKHGSVFAVRYGMRDVIILNDYQTVKSAFVDDGSNYSGRWKVSQSLLMSGYARIAFIDGEMWQIQRPFVLKVFHDFGIGKSVSYEIARQECLYLIDELETLNGKWVDVSDLIHLYTVNIISKFITNKRFSRKEDKYKTIGNLGQQALKQKDCLQLLFYTLPLFDKMTWLCDWILRRTNRKVLFDAVDKLVQEEIDEHRKTLDLNSEGEDLIDRFLIKQHQLKASTGSSKQFTDFQLRRLSLELLLAGLETTTTSLEWSFLFMSKYTIIQQKVHEEIVNIIGKERFPTLNDKKDLHYTQAVIDEIFRVSSVGPLALVHRAMNDSSINGYHVPKDSLVYSNLYACHFDEKVWEKPKEFYPERFLSTDINGDIKYKANDSLNPFGVGKRRCTGESLARMEIFVFFTSIMQRFEVRFAEDVSDALYEEALIGNEGIVRGSKIKNYIFTKLK